MPESSPMEIGIDSSSRVEELRATRCRLPETGEEDGIYLFEEMTNALAQEPALAAKLTFSSVKTCKDAKAFVAAYRALEIEQPGFDDVPLPEASMLRIVEGSLSGGEAQPATTVVSQGLTSDATRDNTGAFWPFPTNPVVKTLLYTLNLDRSVRKESTCSSTFIAKNWILTAAHCLGTIFDKNKPPTLGGYAYVKVSWAATESSMTAVSHEEAFGTYQIPHPSYNPDADRDWMDVALLHFPLSDKNTMGKLPPDLTQGGAAYLSGQLPSSNPGNGLFMSGWGFTGDLRFATAPPLTISGSELVAAPLPWNGALVCQGDSGGPLFRSVTFQDLTRIVVAGVLSRGEPDSGRCATIGTTIYWTRVDTPAFRVWLTREMAKWYGQLGIPLNVSNLCGFTGLPGPLRAHQCWGKPCSSLLPCDKGYVCRGAAEDVTGGCATGLCGDADDPKSCDCLVGQCLVDPNVK